MRSYGNDNIALKPSVESLLFSLRSECHTIVVVLFEVPLQTPQRRTISRLPSISLKKEMASELVSFKRRCFNSLAELKVDQVRLVIICYYYTPLAKGNLHHLQLTVSDMIGYTSSFSIEDVVLVKKHIDEGLQDHGSTTWQLIQGHGTCLPQEGRGMPPRQKRGSEECFLALTEAHDRLVICQHWHRISSTTWSWRRSHEMLRLNRQLLFLIWPVMIQ